MTTATNVSAVPQQFAFCRIPQLPQEIPLIRGISAVVLRRSKIFSAVVGQKLDRQILRKCFQIENGGSGSKDTLCDVAMRAILAK